MTVGQAITELQKHDPNLQLGASSRMGEFLELYGIWERDGIVGCDMKHVELEIEIELNEDFE